MGGCAVGLCAGTLVTSRHVLSAYHCTYHPSRDTGKRPCNHSDGRRVAVLGQDRFSYLNINKYYKIPIIGGSTARYTLLRC
jgi:V8-like Glu-specific endopeptidase